MAAQHIVVVGKSGVGKSTVAANLSAALAESGKRVLLVGYDSHRSSTATLRSGKDLAAFSGWEPGEEAPLWASGYRGSLCIEAGARVGVGELEAPDILAHPFVVSYHPDFVVHDTNGEPAAAFDLPPGIEGVPQLLAVTSADKCALQVVNSLFAWFNTLSAAECRFSGIVANNLTGSLYESIVTDFASHTGAVLSATIPRSIMISVSEFYSQTILESAPFSHVSFTYRKLARTLAEGGEHRRPKQLQPQSLSRWAQAWGDVIAELETGVVTGGLGI